MMKRCSLAWILALLILGGTQACAAPARAYVWNLTPEPILVAWEAGGALWVYQLESGETVSAATSQACELHDLYWQRSGDSAPQEGLARLCPGQVWTIRADGESIGPVPDSWATSPPPRVNTARPR